jgi:hypothetical protein
MKKFVLVALALSALAYACGGPPTPPATPDVPKGDIPAAPSGEVPAAPSAEAPKAP